MQNPQVQELVHDQRSGVIDKAERLRDVALRFLTSDCDLFAVTDSSGRLLGVITESAVVRSLLANPTVTTTIEAYVLANVDSVRSTATLSSVLHLFRASCHTAIPVVDPQDLVCGLLLRRDVMAAMLNTSETKSGPVKSGPVPSINTNGGLSDSSIHPTAPVIQDPQGVRLKFDGARLDQAEETRFPKTSAAKQKSIDLETSESVEGSILKGNFGGPDTGSCDGNTNGNGNGVNERVDAASSSDAIPTNPPETNDNSSGSSTSTSTSGPHFLKGEAARRRLNSMIDFRGGFNESPW